MYPLRHGTTNTATPAPLRALRVLIWRFAGAGLALISTAVVTRSFGATAAGVYFLAVTICSIVVTISRLGLDLPTMRLVSAPSDARARSEVRTVLRVAVGLSGVVALGLTVGLFAGAGLLANLFDEPNLRSMLRLTSLGTVPAVIGVLYARGLIGIGLPVIAEIGQRAGVQLTFLAALAVLMPAAGTSRLGIAYSVSHAAMCLLVLGTWRQSTTDPPRAVNHRSIRHELLSSGLPLLVAAAMNLVVAWSDILMLGYLLDSAAVAVYSAAYRVAAVVSFVLVAAGSVAGPRFAKLLEQSDRTTLERVFQRASRGSALAAITIAAPLLAFSPRILAVFGEGFSIGSEALRLLVVAQLVHSVAGLVGLMLAMAKRERRLMSSTIAAAALNIVFNVLLIPTLGILGAAISTFVALVTLNTMNCVWVYRDLGIAIVGRIDQRAH